MAKSVSHQSSDHVRQAARSYIAELRAKRLKQRGGNAAQNSVAQPQSQTQVPAQPHSPDAQAAAHTLKASPKVGKRGVKSSVSTPDHIIEAGDNMDGQDALRASVLAELRDISGNPDTPEAATPKAKAKTAGAKKSRPASKPTVQKKTTAENKPANKAPAQAQAQAQAQAKTKAKANDQRPTSDPNARLKARQEARAAIRTGAEQARAAAHEAQQKIRAARLTQRAAAAKQKNHLQAAKAKRDAQKTGNHAAAAEPGEQPRRRWVPQRSVGLRHSPARAQTMASKPPTSPTTQAGKTALNARTSPQTTPSLTALRGIGDAMNKRLEQAGICTLDDLVALKAETIRARLGPVSALANIEGWQEEAAKELPH